MNHIEAGRYWNDNAAAWTELSRAGYDICRDAFNTPSFLAILPNIRGMHGLDIGCGEGHNTRLLAERGAHMTAVDISEVFIRHARQHPSSRTIDFCIASAVDLPFPSESFDFVASFMCFMDVPETERVISEAFRVLKPAGFLQFSITHPCFDTPHRRNVRTAADDCVAVEVGDYFQEMNGRVSEWTFSATPPATTARFAKFKVPLFNRTLSFWLNTLITSGFTIEWLAEPYPSDEVVNQRPGLQPCQVVAYILHVRARKPSAASPEGHPNV